MDFEVVNDIIGNKQEGRRMRRENHSSAFAELEEMCPLMELNLLCNNALFLTRRTFRLSETFHAAKDGEINCANLGIRTHSGARWSE